MATGGWKTASMFRRYAIVSSVDQRDAMKALEETRTRDAEKAANDPANDPSPTEADLNGFDMKGVSVQ